MNDTDACLIEWDKSMPELVSSDDDTDGDDEEDGNEDPSDSDTDDDSATLDPYQTALQTVAFRLCSPLPLHQ